MIEEKEHYQKITGHVRASTLTGKFVSGCVAQILATVYGTPPFNALVYMSIFGIVKQKFTYKSKCTDPLNVLFDNK